MRIVMRKINISNELKRDAEVAYGTTFRRESTSYRTASGSEVSNVRRLKTTMQTSDASLIAEYGEGLADAIQNGDPEVDMNLVGLNLNGLTRVYVTPQLKVAYGAILNEHVYLPDGSEKEVRPMTSNAANIALDGVPVRWTGKLIPKEKAMRMFMFKKSYQVQHVNGLTYDFLYEIWKEVDTLEDVFISYQKVPALLKEEGCVIIEEDFRKDITTGIYVCNLNAHYDIDALTTSKEVRKYNLAENPIYWCNYGVADNASQVLAYYDRLMEEHTEYMNARDFVILMSPIFRDSQPQDGGWRWHKWGPYIGKFESKCEYLYDEQGIDFVYVFSIIEVEEEKGD